MKRASARSFLSRSPEETAAFGEALARGLGAGSVILLRGSLGAGKTTLARGLARGFGLEDPMLVSSPSFTLVNLYPGRCPIYHVDLYRLERARDAASLGLEEFLAGEGVTIVEWGERLPFRVPEATHIDLEDAGGDCRVIRVRSKSLLKERKGVRPSKERDEFRSRRRKR